MIGSGTVASPYEIVTIADLNNVKNNLKANYKLMNDLDLSSVMNFIPIGVDYNNSFQGVFDGNGKKIKNLTINKASANIGLFAYIRNAAVKNLAIVDCLIKGTTGTNYVGGITGYATASAIDQCSVTGEMLGQYGVGGIIGWSSETIISDCWASCKTDGAGRVGGIAGNFTNATSFLKSSYAYGTGSASASGFSNQALVGDLLSGATAANNILNSFYNVETNAISNSGTGLMTSQFANPSNFASWDSSIWGFGEYPYLKAFGVPSLPAKKQTVTVKSYSELFSSSLTSSKRKLQAVLTSTLPMSQSLSKEALAIAESTIDDIVSNVEALQNANVKTHIVSSYVDGIGSTSQRLVKAIRSVESTLQPFSILTEIVIPVDVERPVYATVYVMENQTNLNIITNKSDTSIKENTTEMQVV